MPEQLIEDRDERIEASFETLRADLASRTPEERAAGLARGVDMLVEDLPENREFYDRMKGLRALEAAGVEERSDRLHELSRQMHGPLGYDTTLAEKRNP